VLYYQFDRDRFLDKQYPSHLDLDAQLPGEIAFDLDELVSMLTAAAQRDFTVGEDVRRRSSAFIEHRDVHSCERIYALAERRGGLLLHLRRLRDGEWSGRLFTRFRASRFYVRSMRLMFALAKALPRRDLVVFESGVARHYGDSPRAIHERLLERAPGLSVAWINNTSVRIPGTDVEKVKRLSPRYYWLLGRARYWVNNQNFPHYLKPARGTRYLQTWHGTPLKKMQHDIDDIAGRDPGYLSRVTKMTGYWDALVSPSEYASTAFRSAFRFTGEMLEVGYPRNDLFHAPDRDHVARLVRRRLGIPPGRKVALYAPTFRDDVKRGNSFLADLRLDLDQLQRRLGDEYVLLLRFHPIVKGLPRITDEQAGFVQDVTTYPEAQELLLASDVLITDYSSIMFDYATLDRPMIFFTYDLDHYADALRGFYLDFRDVAPGPLLTTSEEVRDALADLGEVDAAFAAKRAAFVQRFAPLDDGHAADRVIDRFFGPEL
jgi:CDP-glycerol glycerophosphotransferase